MTADGPEAHVRREDYEPWSAASLLSRDENQRKIGVSIQIFLQPISRDENQRKIGVSIQIFLQPVLIHPDQRPIGNSACRSNVNRRPISVP